MPLVGKAHADWATPASDGDHEGGVFVVGDEGERGVAVRVTKNGQQTFATTETRLHRAWASKTALWGIDTNDALYRIDLATRAVHVEHPNVGPLRAITGAETSGSDIVVVVGDYAAVWDESRFTYPIGNTAGTKSIAMDAPSQSAYVSGDQPPRRIHVGHPALLPSAKAFDFPFVEGTDHGPVKPPERRREKRTLPSFRLAYGYGRQGSDRDSSEFDLALGLRIGTALSDEAHFFVWPEAGYTASGKGRYAMLGAGVHYGTPMISTGPSIRGLAGAEEGGSQAAGIRTTWQVSLAAGLLGLELGHQLMFVPGGPRSDGRALASVDLLAAGGLALWIGVPLGLVSGFLITEALR
jgi:hypothetical protein